jgi:hypothetical protein
MLKTIKLVRVQFMPKVLEPGILYVAEEFGAAAHLCACGCGAKIRTPLGPTDWKCEETKSGPSLHPSVGNWQQSCQSHYWVYRGRIIPAPKWSREEIASGREFEHARHRAHYEGAPEHDKESFENFWSWVKKKFRE